MYVVVLDKPRLIERILNNNDVKQSTALMIILDRVGFTVEMVLNSIDDERKTKGLTGWA